MATTDDAGAYSPGPWKLYLDDDVISADDEVVCRKHWDVHEENGSATRWKADAALIIEAPEMLALLREFRDRAFEDTGFDWDNRARALLSRLDAAAAGKAGGT